MPALVDVLLRDARYACRMLRKAPAFAAAAILTIALAIAVNTAVFSVVDAVLLRPLPYPDPDRLALVSRVVTADGLESRDTSVDGSTWEAVRDTAHSVDRAVFSRWTTGVNLVAPGAGGSGRARHVRQQRVGAGFFKTLGTAPGIGRGFESEEDRPGGATVTVLSAALWRDFFEADPSIVGRTIVLRGAPYTVVGVMPEGFQSSDRADLWTPLRPATTGEGGGENYQVVLRLREGESWARTAGELRQVSAAVRSGGATEGAEVTFSTVPLQRGLAESLRRPLLILWAAVGLVLVVACVNLAGLLLARGSQRTREIATRIALGSGRAGVIRQLLVESLVLGSIGGAAGVLLALAAVDGLTWLARDAYGIWQPVSLDARSAGLAVLLSLLTSVLFGLGPAWQAARVDVSRGLVHSRTRGVAAGASSWPRRLLVVTQVALGMMLLVSAALLVRTFVHLRGLDPGFDPHDVVAAAVSLEDERYRTQERAAQFFDRTLARLAATPGIESAAVGLEGALQEVVEPGLPASRRS